MRSYKFCPVCGHRFSAQTSGGRSRLVCKSCGFIFYQNAKPATCGFIVRNGKILLVKRAIAPKKGWWDVPGGFVEESEHPEAGLRRELKEELGVSSRISRFLGIFVDIYYNGVGPRSKVLNMYYLAYIAGKLRPADDISEARWFSLDKLPKGIAFRHIKKAIRKWSKLVE